MLPGVVFFALIFILAFLTAALEFFLIAR